MEGGSKRAADQKAWDDLLAFFNRFPTSNTLFRGHGSDRYKLIPKVGRPYGGRDIYDPHRERVVFENFKRRAFLKVPANLENDLDWLAVAQHHGLPTRLLDWTPNPLVAAFFAVSTHSAGGDASRIYALRIREDMRIKQDAKPFDPTMTDVGFHIPPYVSDRVGAQRGCFSVHPDPTSPYHPQGLQWHDVPASACAFVQRRLFAFGVDASTIMADLDGLARALEWQYLSGVGVGKVNF
ncbi:MAG: hypothetical protein RLY86_3418 [Pseudomonadota bacterium]|jgi:hypothetical protein